MASKVEEFLGPVDSDSMRAIFLYVGQGESTFLQIPDGNGGHKTVLIDCNRDLKNGGIDLVRFLLDVLPASGDTKDTRPRLDYFINTHPHSDHVGGIDLIREAVRVGEVWHSGHWPGPEHEGSYNRLQDLIEEVKKAKGQVVELNGSNTAVSIGQAEVHVLSPAKHVCESVDEMDDATRYTRIHEQCAVLNFRYGSDTQKAALLITGDSDKTAWKEHIRYHHEDGKDHVKANVLSASHHGSYTFFKDSEKDEEPYEDHLATIDPDHIIVSAPDQADSKFDHPHDETMERYRAHVGEANVHHMSSAGHSIVVTVYADGLYDLVNDEGKIAAEFKLEDPDAPKKESVSKSMAAPAVIVSSRVEQSRPMG